MPNWMNNTLSVSGTEEDVKIFIAKANEEPSGNSGILSFANFVKPESELTAEEVWGCKWDASSVAVSNRKNGYVEFTFQTPWGAPVPVLKAMSNQFSNLDFSMTSIEEQGWGEEYVANADGFRLVSQWDAPESHEERIDVLGWCWCKEEGENVFDDCGIETEEEDSSHSEKDDYQPHEFTITGIIHAPNKSHAQDFLYWTFETGVQCYFDPSDSGITTWKIELDRLGPSRSKLSASHPL